MATETVNQAATDHDDRIDLHGIYREQVECGYTHNLTIPSIGVQSIAQKLRGISAISSVLIVGESLDVKLGAWLRSGLTEAIYALTNDVISDIENRNEDAREKEQRTA